MCLSRFFQVNVKQIVFDDGKMIPAAKYGAEDTSVSVTDLSAEEEKLKSSIQVRR